MKLYLKATDIEDYDTLSIDKLSKVIPISKGDILEVEDLLGMIRDLYDEYRRLEEEYEELKQENENLRNPEPRIFDYSEWKMSQE